MKNLKSITLSIALLVVTALLLVGCTTTKSTTYSVETGDSIKITLDTSDGYDIDTKNPFTISKDEETISSGTFITLDTYEQYLDAVAGDASATVIDENSKNGVDYLFYRYDGDNTEYNYIIKVHDSNTGLLLGNIISQESAEKCFGHLAFTNDN